MIRPIKNTQKIESPFFELVDKGLFGQTYLRGELLDILEHNSFVIGGRLLTLFSIAIGLTLLSQSDLLTTFIDTFGKRANLHAIFVFMAFLAIVCSFAAPMTQAIVMLHKRKLPKKTAWIIHALLSVDFFILIAFLFNYHPSATWILPLLWGVSIGLILIKIFFSAVQGYTWERLSSLLFIAIAGTFSVNWAVKKVMGNLKKKSYSKQVNSVLENKGDILKKFSDEFLWVQDNFMTTALFWLSVAYFCLNWGFDTTHILESFISRLGSHEPLDGVGTGVMLSVVIVIVMGWMLLRMRKTMLRIYAKVVQSLLND